MTNRQLQRLVMVTVVASVALASAPDLAARAADEGKIEVKRDTGPAVGPARHSGLKCLGRLRTRRSEEIAGSRWGVACHWIAAKHELTTEQRVEQLARLGAKWGFLVPDWDVIETEKGKYDFNSPESRLDDAVRGMVKRKITPIIQVYGGNRLYMPAALDPNKRQLADAARLLDDPEVRQAWHRFLEAMARRYRAHVKVWEIWNEPNGPWFWKKPTTVGQYGRMVKEASEVIRSVDPDAVILAGSTAMIPMGFFEGLLASAGADSFDYCSVHPYGAVPERSDGGIRALQKLLASRGKSSVLWQSECGFPSSADTGGWGYGGPWDETKHAKWVLRRLLCDASLGMKVSIYFVLNDYPSLFEAGPRRGQMATNRKGLHFAGSWEPKPAAYAFRNLASLIDDRFEPKPVKLAVQILDGGPEKGDKSNSPRSGPEGASHKLDLSPFSGRIHTYTLTEKQTGSPVIAYWLGVPMQTEFATAKARITLPDTDIPEPVLVDLLDGNVYAIGEVGRDGKGTILEGMPLADSPLVLCSRGIVSFEPRKK